MKLKRILVAVLVWLAFAAALPQAQVLAAENKPVYKYRVVVRTTGESNSQGDAGKVQALLVFGNQTFYGTLNNANA